MKLTADRAKALAILVGVAVAGVVLWRLYSAGSEAAGEVVDFVTKTANPLSDENAVYRAFDTRDASGQVVGSLGTNLYDGTHNADGSWRWPWEEPR